MIYITILLGRWPFSTLDKLAAVIPKKNKSDMRAWLELQDSYITDLSADGSWVIHTMLQT